MSRFRRTAFLAAAAAALLAQAAAPSIARAQDQGNGFLFGSPRGSFTLTGGWAQAMANSDLFSFSTDQLTLRKRDFSSPTIGGDLAFQVVPRTAIVVSSSLSGMNKKSEFRHFIDNNNLPIEQTTSFRRVPLTIGVREYLTDPGRAIGRFAWIPSRFAPYVGAGGGGMWYQFKQYGDFIDFQTTNVFNDLYESDGWTATGNALAGIDYSMGPRFALTTEAKYVWASARLSNDFSGFHNLDLSGFATTVGVSVRF